MGGERSSLQFPRNKIEVNKLKVAACSPDKLIPARIILSLLTTFLVFHGVRVNGQSDSAPSSEFTDVTKSAGIKLVHLKGNQGVSINLEEFGPGVCVSDFDQDGWQDIYFVNGRDRYDRGIVVKNALYRNNGDNTFTDVTERAGVPGTGYGLGCAWGDYDNDGFPDLFVTQYGSNVLYHNNADGTFTDVTAKAGVAGLESGPIHSGAVFVDYDRDGWLDLYVGSYVAFGAKARRYCDIGGVMSSCPPSAYRGSPNALYHNNGDGTFSNVSAKANILQPEGKNLSVGAADYDNDGWPDLFVANDCTRIFTMENFKRWVRWREWHTPRAGKTWRRCAFL
jgi:enediyne biosynthesis protein E4